MTILFPAIFFVILGILNLCIIHYQNVSISAEAMRAASRTASYWEYADGSNPLIYQDVPAVQMIEPKSFLTHDPYRYLFDGKAGQKESNSGAYAGELIDSLPILLGGHESRQIPRVYKSGGIMQKYICVEAKRQDIVPMGDMFAKFGVRIPTDHTVTAKARLNNPGEFVRNTSFIYDIIHEWGESK